MTAHWLVEIDLSGGRTLRLASADLEVLDNRGAEHIYAWGVIEDPDGVAPGDDGIELVLALPAGILSDPLLLEQSPIRLARWTEGTVLESATVYATGRIGGLEYAGTSDPVSLEIELDAEHEPQVPDMSARVDDGVTLPITGSGTAVVSGHEGHYYPIVYGFPGYGPTGGRQVVPAPFGQYLAADFNDTFVVLSEGDLLAGTSANTVGLLNYGSTPNTTGTQSWRVITDNLGQRLTIADFTLDSTQVPNAANAPSAKWYAKYSPEGGGGRYRDAYSVIVDLLRRWGGSTRIDWGMMAGVEGVIAGYQVDTWINGATTARGWIDDVLLPDLPVVWRQGRQGWYLTWDRRWATALDAIGRLDAGALDCDRRSPIKVDSKGLTNEVHARFWRTVSGSWWGTRTITATDGHLTQPWFITGNDTRVLGHPLAAASQAAYGVRSGTPLDLDWTWDLPTVLQVLHDRLERDAFPRRSVTYWLPEPTLAAAEVVLLTDPELGLVSQVAIVAEPPFVVAGGGAMYSLRLVPAL